MKPISRRSVLLYSSCGAAWASVAGSAAFASAHQHAAAVVEGKAAAELLFFTKEEASEIDALTAVIIPSDSTPGAREAGVLHFIDRALATFDQEKQPLYWVGLAQLRAKVETMFSPGVIFSRLTHEQQQNVLAEIEQSEFFNTLRTHTVMGFFGNPAYGGNKNKVGWNLIGFEDSFTFHPPFGHYDAEQRASASGDNHAG